MKVIDLLNKIANGEEVPHIIYLWGKTEFYFNEDRRVYCDKHDTELGHHVAIDMILDREVDIKPVEILEEEKKIPEKLGEVAKTDEEYAYCWTGTEAKLKDKINEIIDYLKSKGE